MPQSERTQRLTILYDALEKEGPISYEKLSILWDVSRMSAYRRAARLTDAGLLCEKSGKELCSQRKMKLLSLPQEPTCLLLDMQYSHDTMQAFYVKGNLVSHFCCAYHPTYGDTHGQDLNAQRLLLAARNLWDISSDLSPVIYPRSTTRDKAALLCPQKTDALLYLVSHHPDLANMTSILFLRTDTLPYAVHFIRSNPHTPWRISADTQFLSSKLRSLGLSAQTNPQVKTNLLNRYLADIRRAELLSPTHSPQLIITEEESLPSQDSASCPASLKLRIPLAEDAHERTHLYRRTTPLPSWVYGAVGMIRREDWLKKAVSLLSKQKEA